MALNTFLDFSETAASNIDVAGIGIQGTNAVQNFDNAFRQLMAILRRDLDNGVVLTSKSANYTAVANDNNALIRFSAAATLSLTAAATLGSGWHCWVMADGGAVVIDPNSSETINGATTITVPDGFSTLIICDGTNFRALEDYATVSTALATKQDNSGELYRGHINGLTLSNNVSDATNDIDIATGSAGSDGTTPVLMTLASALTKRLDAAWAVGTGNGGLDTGTIANTTYHIFLIRRSDTGVVDALFSTSASSPTMPTNYDQKRRIGSIVRSGGAILAFTQVGDEFRWVTPPALDVDVTNQGGTAITRTLTVPTGLEVLAMFRAYSNNASGWIMLFRYPSDDDGAPSTAASPVGDMAGAAGALAAGQFSVRTNTAAQIRTRSSTANTILRIATYGWIDTRGKDA